MAILTILVAFLLFGVLGPRWMDPLDRFIAGVRHGANGDASEPHSHTAVK